VVSAQAVEVVLEMAVAGHGDGQVLPRDRDLVGSGRRAAGATAASSDQQRCAGSEADDRSRPHIQGNGTSPCSVRQLCGSATSGSATRRFGN
jgi:hypothetical protein